MAKFAVALVADDRMLPAAAYLASRLHTLLGARTDVDIAIYSDAMQSLKAAHQFNVPAQLKYVDFRGAFPRVGHVSGAAFFRLFLPDVAAPDVERLIYVDVDIALEDDRLLRLLDLDLHGYTIAAVRDLTMSFEPRAANAKELALAGPSGKYFYSGMLVIDCARYRAANLSKRIFDFAMARGLHDQAAMNGVLQGNWLELSPAMNMTTPLWNSFVRKAFPPSLIHFMGPVKPWDADYPEDHPIRSDMVRYFAASPWPSFVKQPNFAAAWARRGSATAPPPRKFVLSEFADVAGMTRLLRTTPFADVDQGISEFREAELPVLPATAPG
jgi:lipopolysaccharide biosynthesis glycosyltransferase